MADHQLKKFATGFDAAIKLFVDYTLRVKQSLM